jgi:hypothetical protein
MYPGKQDRFPGIQHPVKYPVILAFVSFPDIKFRAIKSGNKKNNLP